jgi:hypothetical protein
MGYSKPAEKFGGYEPVTWCKDRLAPHVTVVTPQELIWRARLYLKTRETLDALAKRLQTDGRTDTKIALYRAWLRNANLDTDTQRRAAFEKLQGIR